VSIVSIGMGWDALGAEWVLGKRKRGITHLMGGMALSAIALGYSSLKVARSHLS
jgi:hypothetical protein